MKRHNTSKKTIGELGLNSIAILFILIVFYCFSLVLKSMTQNLLATPQQLQQKIDNTSQGPIRIPILIYHYVEYNIDEIDTIRRSLNIAPNIFEEQLKTLKNDGYAFLTMREVADILNNKLKMPEKAVALTFDDGHWDFYTVIMPLLKKHNAKGTVFVITRRIGGSDFLSKKQMIEATQSARVEIGSHSISHNPLNGLLYGSVEKEVVDSKKYLETEFNYRISSFAYPNGTYDGQAAAVVKKAGYTSAVSTKKGTLHSPENKYQLTRIRPGKRTGQDLINYLAKHPN